VIEETNLSAYLLAPVNAKLYCLDAGTINAIEMKKYFTVPAATVLRIHKGLLYFSCTFRSCFWIINSPADVAKFMQQQNAWI
jgi:hypothetical protein